MAGTPITDVLVVNWANTRARPLSDQILQLYYAMLGYQADYANAGIAAAITADGTTGTIVDGSASDGRTPITGASLVNLIAGVNALMTQYAANVSGVGVPITTIAGGIQVNGSPR